MFQVQAGSFRPFGRLRKPTWNLKMEAWFSASLYPQALAEVGRLQERAKVANQDRFGESFFLELKLPESQSDFSSLNESDVFVSDFFVNWSKKPTDTYAYPYKTCVLQNVYIVSQILYTYNPSHILVSCGKFIGTFNFEQLSRRTIPVTC